MEILTREDYELIFKKYPDVVTLTTFRQMLGGLGDNTARRLMQGDFVEHFVINNTYYIPKQYVIDYLMTGHYLQSRIRWKCSIDTSELKKEGR